MHITYRMDCIADGVENVNPDIYLNRQPVGREYKDYNWPTQITLSAEDGIVTAGRLGEYTCGVEGMRNISHFINNS